MSATASKTFKLGPESCVFMQLFETTCVRNVSIANQLDHEKLRHWYHMKEEGLFYQFLTTLNLFCVLYDCTTPCWKFLRQTWQLRQVLNFLIRGCRHFTAYCWVTIRYEWKLTVPCERWGNVLSVLYRRALALPVVWRTASCRISVKTCDISSNVSFDLPRYLGQEMNFY